MTSGTFEPDGTPESRNAPLVSLAVTATGAAESGLEHVRHAT
jgi:hypothetical protein